LNRESTFFPGADVVPLTEGNTDGRRLAPATLASKASYLKKSDHSGLGSGGLFVTEAALRPIPRCESNPRVRLRFISELRNSQAFSGGGLIFRSVAGHRYQRV
jgi:hypothetical protein